MDTIGDLLGRLDGVRKGRAPEGMEGQWSARCPAHDDRRSSLSVALTSPDDQGVRRVLQDCHAGCSPQDVCKAEGLDISDLFINPEPRVTASYDWHDERGNVIATKLRWRNKPQGKFTWRGGLDGLKLPLYRLPELKEACIRGDVVVVAEGPGDADALASIGLCATCPPHGAAKGGKDAKWQGDHTDSLRGASRVLVLPDNDEVGREWSATITHTLIQSGLNAELVTLPGLEGSDPKDWATSGGTVAKLLSLADSANLLNEAGWDYQPKEVLMEEADPTWLVDRLILRGGVSLVVGGPKAGKSTFTRDLATALASYETEWLGHPCTGGDVFLVSLEDAGPMLKAHFLAIQNGNGVCPQGEHTIYVHRKPPPPGAPLALHILLKSLPPARRPCLVVIDTLQRFARIENLNSYSEVVIAIEPLMQAARDTGVHIMILHHSAKGALQRNAIENPLGSQALGGSVDTVMAIRHKDTGQRTLEVIQRHGPDMDECFLDMADNGRLKLGGKVKAKARDDWTAELEDDLLLVLAESEGIGLKALYQELQPENTTRKAMKGILQGLVSRGQVATTPSRYGGHPLYQLPTEEA